MYRKGIDRNQVSFLPVCVDDYVGEGHICRAIEAFVEQLDVKELGFCFAEYNIKGGSVSYDPKDMLKLYLYGYLHRVRSSRRMEAEAGRNIEVMWLMQGLKPDDKTICNFRKNNAEPIKKVFREFVKLSRDLDLCGGENTVLAVDGTRLRADNSRKNNHNKVTIKKQLERIEKSISEYMIGFEQADNSEQSEVVKIDAAKALEHLARKKEKYTKLKEQVEQQGEVSTVDVDARLMHSGGDARKLDVCHNLITATDSKHGLIVSFEVTSTSDKGNLQAVSTQARSTLEQDKIIVLSDKGFYDGDDIAKCEQEQIQCIIAKPAAGGKTAIDDAFVKSDFVFDKEQNCYMCPAGQCLTYRQSVEVDGREYDKYANYKACNRCKIKEKCTKKHRTILRHPHQAILDEVDERTVANKALYKRRGQIVEHPFGTIKAVWGFKQCLTRTTKKVSTEAALTLFAYNFRRVFNILTQQNKDPVTKIQQLYA